jgi:hypothetical protein
MLETIGNTFEATHPELLEIAEDGDREDKIAERRERIERHCAVADALAVEIRALENGARQEYKAKDYSNGYIEEAVCYLVDGQLKDGELECVKDCGAR